MSIWINSFTTLLSTSSKILIQLYMISCSIFRFSLHSLYFTSFFFYMGFFLRTFTNHRTAEEGGGHFFNSSLPLLPASQAFRHQPGDYCRELTSAHSQQPDSNREPLISERKLLTTKLRALP